MFKIDVKFSLFSTNLCQILRVFLCTLHFSSHQIIKYCPPSVLIAVGMQYPQYFTALECKYLPGLDAACQINYDFQDFP